MILFILSTLALLLQVGVVIYGLKMLKLVKWLDNWTPAWVMFIIAMGLIFLRRVIWTIAYVGDLDPNPGLEAVLTIFVSLFSLLFVWFIHKTFTKYIKDNPKE